MGFIYLCVLYIERCFHEAQECVTAYVLRSMRLGLCGAQQLIRVARCN